MEGILTLILLALAAGFMPLQFGAEIYLLGTRNGVPKVLGFVAGVTAFRFLLAAIFVLIFAVFDFAVRHNPVGLRQRIASGLGSLGLELSDGSRFVLLVMLIIVGVFLILQAYRMIRGGVHEGADNRFQSLIEDVGVRRIVIVGLLWSAFNINQWVFVTAGFQQIAELTPSILFRGLWLLVFFVMASVMLLLPVLLVLVWPKQAGPWLEKLNTWMQKGFWYTLAGLFGVLGVMLVGRSVVGLVGLLG